MSPYREDQLLGMLSGHVKGWVVVELYGRSRQYEIRATAWKFSGTLVALLSPDNDDFVDSDRVRKAFEAIKGPPDATSAHDEAAARSL